MKKIAFTTEMRLIIVLLISSCGSTESPLSRDYPESISMSVANHTEMPRQDEVVILSVDALMERASDFNTGAFIVLSGDQELACQADDVDADGDVDLITLVDDFLAGEEKTLTLRYAGTGKKPRTYAKRTQAELSHKFGGHFEDRKYLGGEFRNVKSVNVPAEHTDHSLFFRYEGPGWESDKVGYRFYLDWRNAIDIFGKKVPDMVLQNVGQDGFDSYHEMAEWGMDILKVGESLGMGSVGMWHDGKVFRVSDVVSSACKIVADGPVYSQIRTDYYGWKVDSGSFDLVSDLSITAGSRLTQHTLQISGDAPNICTGLVKDETKDAKLIEAGVNAGGWTYLATYGKQSLAGDDLGMAVLFRESDLIEVTEDSLSHVVVLRPQDGAVTYYFLAAWEQEPDGIRSAEEFHRYLDDTVARLNEPIVVVFK